MISLHATMWWQRSLVGDGRIGTRIEDPRVCHRSVIAATRGWHPPLPIQNALQDMEYCLKHHIVRKSLDGYFFLTTKFQQSFPLYVNDDQLPIATVPPLATLPPPTATVSSIELSFMPTALTLKTSKLKFKCIGALPRLWALFLHIHPDSKWLKESLLRPYGGRLMYLPNSYKLNVLLLEPLSSCSSSSKDDLLHQRTLHFTRMFLAPRWWRYLQWHFDAQVGLVVGNIGFVRRLFEKFSLTFGFIIDFGMMCYMFALGIEMDPCVLLARPTRHTKVAVAGVICTFIIAGIATPILRVFPSEHKLVDFTLALSTLLSSTDSPVLTRLITQLQIGKSDIGKLVIGAGVHSDFLCYLILSIGYIVMPLPQFCHHLKGKIDPKKTIKMGCVVLVQVVFTAMVSPILMNWLAMKTQKFEARHFSTWARLLLLLGVATAGKVAGTVISGAMLGFRWPESVAIGMLLVTKGHLHIYLAIKVIGCGATSISTGIVMVIAAFLTALPVPAIAANIIKRAKKRAPTHRLALQLLDPSSELRILLCVQGPQNVPASINLVEITKGTADAGIVVYVTDMIELTSEISDTLERDEGVHTATVKDKEVMDMRNQVTNSFQACVVENDDGITLKRTMALSTINNMPQDICILAEDLMIALIILPFHRSQREDGKLDGGNSGFRYMNRKVLRSAPCSVGILVDRGLGSVEHISRCQVALNVAVIFIGGKDDREALAYASRVARHPRVKLTVIRFLVDSSVESSSLYRIILPEQEKETKLDDECFTQFYERHVIGGRIAYMEKYLANAAETFSTLRSFEGQHSLVIVGREGGMNSILTRGMNDWQQCPELGPIGDVLSGSDFSMTVSILIIQQHRLKGEIDGLNEDFSII
ncbi:Cation/H(+) antiporter 28 [Spatholobus suberectus]|nr:Cation/H(+) antiporter 28 [Spatholobus suberectus]